MSQDIIVGVMWAKNEEDLLPHTIPAALKKVDCLMVADDDSEDNSWDIIKSFSNQLEYIVRRADKISDTTYQERVFSRQHLLDEVRKRFGTKDVWVQVIESDVSILDTDVRQAIRRCSVDDVGVRWHMLNACRREWTPEYDLLRIPPGMDLYSFYDAAYWMEQISYTFRPLPKLVYTERPVPWPQGFSHYLKSDIPVKLEKRKDSPLLIHWGFRSPRFYFEKVKIHNKTISRKNSSWDFSSWESIRKTVSIYNGEYNNNPDVTFEPIARSGWKTWLDWK